MEIRGAILCPFGWRCKRYITFKCRAKIRRGVRLLCIDRVRKKGDANKLVCKCFRDSHGLQCFAFEKHTYTHTHWAQRGWASSRQAPDGEVIDTLPRCPSMLWAPRNKGSLGPHTHTHTHIHIHTIWPTPQVLHKSTNYFLSLFYPASSFQLSCIPLFSLSSCSLQAVHYGWYGHSHETLVMFMCLWVSKKKQQRRLNPGLPN